MGIHPRILEANPQLNAEQRLAISTLDGPLAIIAGPGSGKTRVLVLRTLNILLLEAAQPEEIVLFTFTEKAAFESRDRLLADARTLGHKLDLARLAVGTNHSLCARLIGEEREASRWAAGFRITDEIEQKLFVHERRNEIFVERPLPPPHPDQGGQDWSRIREFCLYSDRITEELIEPLRVAGGARADGDEPLHDLAMAAARYEELLVAEHRIDYVHLLAEAYRLLTIPAVAVRLQARVRFVMIDEHQDTNYVQEQLLRALAAATGNLCVVGDEDQAIYRFRGATARNILEFPRTVAGCATVALTTNYRSHPQIIDMCGTFLRQVDWRGPGGVCSFRYDKTIVHDRSRQFADYPAVVAIRGRDREDEGEQVAALIASLMKRGVITDYNQVAILLSSVKPLQSRRYTAPMGKRNIPVHCPRGRNFFERLEIRAIVGAFLLLLNARPEPAGSRWDKTPVYATYLHAARSDFIEALSEAVDQRSKMRPIADLLAALRSDETIDMRLDDVFHQLMAYEPFCSNLKDDGRASNLARFSQLLSMFQRREAGAVTAADLDRLR